MRRFALPLAVMLLAGLGATSVSAATPSFQASFVNIYSQCPTSPPSLVFCGGGTVAGFGRASSTAWLTAPPAPIAGSDCLQIHAVRQITLEDGAGSLTLAEIGTLCPRSGSASDMGSPYTVAKTYTIAGATGVFAGASGAGSDVNRSAGNEQVSVLLGSINLP
jgi:hypothetical protein